MPNNKEIYTKKGKMRKLKFEFTGKTLRELSEDKKFTIKDFKARYNIK